MNTIPASWLQTFESEPHFSPFPNMVFELIYFKSRAFLTCEKTGCPHGESHKPIPLYIVASDRIYVNSLCPSTASQAGRVHHALPGPALPVCVQLWFLLCDSSDFPLVSTSRRVCPELSDLRQKPAGRFPLPSRVALPTPPSPLATAIPPFPRGVRGDSVVDP
jgi:hypothetical protein